MFLVAQLAPRLFYDARRTWGNGGCVRGGGEGVRVPRANPESTERNCTHSSGAPSPSLSFQGAFVRFVRFLPAPIRPSPRPVRPPVRPTPFPPRPICEVRNRTNKRIHTAAAEDMYIIHTSYIHHTCVHTYIHTYLRTYAHTHTHTGDTTGTAIHLLSQPQGWGREFCVTNGEGEGGRGVS